MIRSVLTAYAVMQFLFSGVLCAEQEVTLKTGTKIIGDVSVDNETVKIKVGGSETTFMMRDVEQIKAAPIYSESNNSVERLLIIALELRLQNESVDEAIALLADAYRQAPDDARIAYWYAKSLADAGLGKEAKSVFEAGRVNISQAYPGLTDKLAHLIQQRVEHDSLPRQLATQLRRLESVIGKSNNRHLNSKYVRFRVLDQNSDPIDKTAVSVVCDGNDKQLTTFPDGYYLLTYNSFGEGDRGCDLVVNWPGLESKQFKLKASADHVRDGGVFVVTRLDESAKVPYKFRALDPMGEPILGAAVTMRPDGRNNGRNLFQTAASDSQGLATIEAFPLGYDYTASAEGYKAETGNVALTNASQDHEERVVLYPALTGSIRYSWSSLEEETPTKTKEIVLPIGQPLNSRQHAAESVSWLQAVQVKDTVTLQRGPAFYRDRSIPGETLWVRRVPDELIKDSPLEYYSQFDLKEIDSIKGKVAETKIKRDRIGNFSFPVQQGEVYVGKLPGLNRQSGRPAVMSFKVYIEKVSAASGSE